MTGQIITKENNVINEIDYKALFERERNDKIAIRQKHEDASRELSVIFPAVVEIMQYLHRNYQREVIIDAAKASYDDTGIELEDTIRILNSYDFDISEDDFRREFRVVVRVPVEVCITVEAIDEDSAEEEAKTILESEGLERYDMEYDMWYDADVTNVEEV